MGQPSAYEGTPEELKPYLAQHPNQRFRLIPLTPAMEQKNDVSHERTIQKGMFPQLKGLTESDFRRAEWHSKESE
jgi:hypothetical protein